MLKTSETGIRIANRFFLALDVLKDMGYLRGMQTFTRDHGISYGHFNTICNNRDIRTVKVEYLAYLSDDYNISCSWLLLGEGEMFAEGGPRKKAHKTTQKSPRT